MYSNDKAKVQNHFINHVAYMFYSLYNNMWSNLLINNNEEIENYQSLLDSSLL